VLVKSMCAQAWTSHSASVSDPTPLSSVRVQARVPAIGSVLFCLWIFRAKAVDFPLAVLLTHV
jgi:hypothetical protein